MPLNVTKLLTTAATTAALALTAGAACAGPLSSLPWPSGGKTNLDCLAAGRGTPVDVRHDHMGAPTYTWADQETAAKGWISSDIKSGPPVALISPWLVTQAEKGNLAQCASGANDSHWKVFGTAWAAAAAVTSSAKPNGTKVIVEPGWEANIGSHSHPWGVDDVSQIPTYKACWQHAAAALRSTFPNVTISWTNAHRYFMNYTVAQMDPGTEDAYGLMYYLVYELYNKTGAKVPITQTTWNNYYNSSNTYGPTGLGAWLTYAKAHGKKLGISEWGEWDGINGLVGSQADDPNYILFMEQAFRNNAASIGWDAYQNNNDSSTVHHALCPNTVFPNAWAKYQATFH